MRVSSTKWWHPVGDRTDKVGRVIVRVILVDRGDQKNMKGNLTRTFTVNDATVSEVVGVALDACRLQSSTPLRITTPDTPPGWGWGN